MPYGFINVIRKIGLNAPPIFLAVLGLLLVFMGAIFNDSVLIDLGSLFCILGFFLSILWFVMHKIISKEKG